MQSRTSLVLFRGYTYTTDGVVRDGSTIVDSDMFYTPPERGGCDGVLSPLIIDGLSIRGRKEDQQSMVDCHPNSRYAHNLCTQCERLLSIMITILFLSPTCDDILVSGNYEKANETHITDTPHRSSHQSKRKKKKVHACGYPRDKG